MRLRLTVLILFVLANLTALFAPAGALADPGQILISELQTGSLKSTGDEFVELYNPGAASVSLSGWKLQYHSATNTDCSNPTWENKLTLGSTAIAGHSYLLMAPKDYLPSADAAFSAGLAHDGGAVRLLDQSGRLSDALAWGNAACGNDDPAPAPPGGGSLERRPGSDAESGGNAYNTGHNAADFQLRSTSQPQSSTAPAENPVTGYVPAAAAPADGPAPLELNELLPDPASPLTDANDEFIEIYNPNSVPVSLSGYVIKTGTNLSTKHTLKAAIVPPAGYLALKSGATKISLANAGSSVALFDPAGRQLGPTITYGKALTGDAWARGDNDTWSWTTTPTPGASNILTEPDPASLVAAAGHKASKTGKTSGAKASKSKTTKAKSTKTKLSKLAAPALAAATSPGGHWLLFTLGGLTIAYVIYEFRHDLRSYYIKLRGYPKASRASSETPPGR
jgi:hypothetical protein